MREVILRGKVGGRVAMELFEDEQSLAKGSTKRKSGTISKEKLMQSKAVISNGVATQSR